MLGMLLVDVSMPEEVAASLYLATARSRSPPVALLVDVGMPPVGYL